MCFVEVGNTVWTIKVSSGVSIDRYAIIRYYALGVFISILRTFYTAVFIRLLQNALSLKTRPCGPLNAALITLEITN